jgi:hypothetical protein
VAAPASTSAPRSAGVRRMYREILDRFRPAGPPGAAGAAGVPADRRADAQRELALLFAGLADVERRCADVRDRADRQAVRRAARSQRMAAAIVDEARSEARATRVSAATRAQADARIEAQVIVEHADKAAADLRRSAEGRMPALVDRILERAGELAESAGADLP